MSEALKFSNNQPVTEKVIVQDKTYFLQVKNIRGSVSVRLSSSCFSGRW